MEIEIWNAEKERSFKIEHFWIKALEEKCRGIWGYARMVHCKVGETKQSLIGGKKDRLGQYQEAQKRDEKLPRLSALYRVCSLELVTSASGHLTKLTEHGRERILSEVHALGRIEQPPMKRQCPVSEQY